MAPSSEAEVILFSHPFSAYAQRARIALNEKGISTKTITIEFGNKPQALLEANPIYKTVPTIIHKGHPVLESLVILEYLEDAWPDQVPLMPKDPLQKSKVRFWSAYIYQSFDKFPNISFKKPGSPEQLAAKEETMERLKTIETAMTSFSTAGPFFTGEKFSYLDVVLSPLVIVLAVGEKFGGFVVPAELPRLRKWIDVIQAKPSYSAAFASNEEAVSFFKPIVEKKLAAAS